MAKNYNFNRSEIDKFTIKGVVSSDGASIDYENSEKELANIAIDKIFKEFADVNITLSITSKQDMDLSKGFEEE